MVPSKYVPSARSLKALRIALSGYQKSSKQIPFCRPFGVPVAEFHSSTRWLALRTHKLSDVGEGTKEVQIIQWFVEEGARVEEWAKLCEVQSDKAAVDITSRYAGVIKKLHFQKDDIVQVGDVMVDFEVEGVEDEDQPPAEEENSDEKDDTSSPEQVAEQGVAEESTSPSEKVELPRETERAEEVPKAHVQSASLATPAVRGLLKQHGIEIDEIEGSGKGGRVLKEDVYEYIKSSSEAKPAAPMPAPTKPAVDAKQTETVQKLTPVQGAMFKTMTASLAIPHFLYSDSVDITRLAAMRTRLNTVRDPQVTPKFSYLPFVIKAVSLALNKYPILNARLDTTSDPKKPQLIMRSIHNIGIAMDTPSGLLVPVIKNVNALSITSIAQEIQRLAQLGKANKLSTADLSGGTISVSNIGSIGGEVVSPVVVPSQLAILGMGKVKTVPIFAEDGQTLERAEMMGMSWSADHRVVDGATVARMARLVQTYLEEPGSMVVDLS